VDTDLITGLRDRGLDTGKPVFDGAKALSRAGKDVFDKPVIARCQQHKIRNVTDELPERLKSVTEKADAAGLPHRVGARGRGRAYYPADSIGGYLQTDGTS
jgi:hypothetical protein